MRMLGCASAPEVETDHCWFSCGIWQHSNGGPGMWSTLSTKNSLQHVRETVTDHWITSSQSPWYNVSNWSFCKPQILPRLTFLPNMAYSVHCACSLATFHIRRWSGWRWCYYKPTRLPSHHWILLRYLGSFPSISALSKQPTFHRTSDEFHISALLKRLFFTQPSHARRAHRKPVVCQVRVSVCQPRSRTAFYSTRDWSAESGWGK